MEEWDTSYQLQEVEIYEPIYILKRKPSRDTFTQSLRQRTLRA
jgi:hypothetical protein